MAPTATGESHIGKATVRRALANGSQGPHAYLVPFRALANELFDSFQELLAGTSATPRGLGSTHLQHAVNCSTSAEKAWSPDQVCITTGGQGRFTGSAEIRPTLTQTRYCRRCQAFRTRRGVRGRMRPRSREMMNAALPFDEPLGEDPEYLTRQLITYIGNKRALLNPIRDAVELVRRRLNKPRLRLLDAFSGSGVVSRLLKQYAAELVVNDIEDYAGVVSACYLTNRSALPMGRLSEVVGTLNESVDEEGTHQDEPGFIERLYAPRDENNITADDRVFYTKENARRLDTYRELIGQQPLQLQPLLLGPLLSEASIHANTAGVFKGFYKDRHTRVGRFGGTRADALDRICGKIYLEPPVVSNYECAYEVAQMDANDLVTTYGDFDLVYFDPPYNQHPYGSNYFMLNLLVTYREPTAISKVSGIPADWRRSDYNVGSKALNRLTELVQLVDSHYILISYNDEGFISPAEMRYLLHEVGSVEEFQLQYPTFRGSRNLRNRSTRVTEHLFLVSKATRDKT